MRRGVRRTSVQVDTHPLGRMQRADFSHLPTHLGKVDARDRQRAVLMSTSKRVSERVSGRVSGRVEVGRWPSESRQRTMSNTTPLTFRPTASGLIRAGGRACCCSPSPAVAIVLSLLLWRTELDEGHDRRASTLTRLPIIDAKTIGVSEREFFWATTRIGPQASSLERPGHFARRRKTLESTSTPYINTIIIRSPLPRPRPRLRALTNAGNEKLPIESK